jgi:hypothetical protein
MAGRLRRNRIRALAMDKRLNVVEMKRKAG